MAEGYNKVVLVGNVGADPELKSTTAGTLLKLRVATNERYTDKNGEKQEKTEWHTVTLWGMRADALGKFIRKGDRLLVEGAIRTRMWETDTGEKRYFTEISAQDIKLLGGGQQGGTSVQPVKREVYEDDMPF